MCAEVTNLENLKRTLYAALLSKSNEELTDDEVELMSILSRDPFIQSLLADKKERERWKINLDEVVTRALHCLGMHCDHKVEGSERTAPHPDHPGHNRTVYTYRCCRCPHEEEDAYRSAL